MNQPPLDDRIKRFLDGEAYAVAGASTNRSKYGNKVLRAYTQAGRPAYPINPRASEIEGMPAYASLKDIPHHIHGVSIITPPTITTEIVQGAVALGIRHIWMQPGAVSDEAVELALAEGVNVIAGDACILVVLGYREM